MHRTLLLALFSLVALPLAAQQGAQPAAAPAPIAVPPIVLEGLQAAKDRGISAATEIWFRGSPIESDSAGRANFIAAFDQMPEYFGRITGSEIIKTFALGTHQRRTYALLLYEGGLLYFKFTYYESGGRWRMQHLDFNADAAQILPAELRLP